MLQDVEMHRGKPLFLNEERYAALTHMVNLYLFNISCQHYHAGARSEIQTCSCFNCELLEEDRAIILMIMCSIVL